MTKTVQYISFFIVLVGAYLLFKQDSADNNTNTQVIKLQDKAKESVSTSNKAVEIIAETKSEVESKEALPINSQGQIEIPEDLKEQLNKKVELPEDLKKQLESPPPELPEDLKAQLNAPPPEVPEDIKKALSIPPREVSIEEVNNPPKTAEDEEFEIGVDE